MLTPLILLADNDEVFLQNAREFLEHRGYRVICATNPLRAREIITQAQIALAVLDYRLIDDRDERDKSGLILVRAMMTTNHVPKIILTKFDRYDYAVESLKPIKGDIAAVDFIVKQEGLERMLQAIEHILVKACIFLCYARPDQEKVAALYEDLAVAGFVPWMDMKSIQGGEKWEVAIRHAIRRADFFVACLSNNSINRRGFMQREIRLALNIWDEKLEDDIYLIPARLEDCDVAHERLQEIQWVDLFKPDGFLRLNQAIRTGIGRGLQR
jgi:CheY-like chemotaxis protein